MTSFTKNRCTGLTCPFLVVKWVILEFETSSAEVFCFQETGKGFGVLLERL